MFQGDKVKNKKTRANPPTFSSLFRVKCGKAKVCKFTVKQSHGPRANYTKIIFSHSCKFIYLCCLTVHFKTKTKATQHYGIENSVLY